MTQAQYFHVIAPVGFDPDWQNRRGIIEQVAARHRVDVRFPDYSPQAPVFRLADLKREFAEAAFVLVDLNHERPSCYYELGIAEALGVRVCLVAECGTPIHQTAARENAKHYATLDEFTAIVERAIDEFIPVTVQVSS
jgi:hypothetical protein